MPNRDPIQFYFPCFLRIFKRSLLIACLLFPWVASAQIVADTHAPGNQQPTILNAANGIPLVNIQTPSAAGVSRNNYTQFDVTPSGAILNNAPGSVNTQQGGWVQGNPWLAGGSAKIILNEVRSTNPSQLNGFLEVAGSKAHVIVANPAGITCDGCGFINASRSTLTTGTPVFDEHNNLDHFRVTGGVVSFTGKGMDDSQTEYTDVMSRAFALNASLQAKHLAVTTGKNRVSIDNKTVTRIAENDPDNDNTEPAPTFAIDAAELGSMYAGSIFLIANEEGVGVRNAGEIGATADDIVITADGWLENKRTMHAKGKLTVHTSGDIDNSGTLSADESTEIATQKTLKNQAKIQASKNLQINAEKLDNTRTGEMIAANNQLNITNTFTNRGLIDGNDVRINTHTLNNLGTGRMYGDHMILDAPTIKNDLEDQVAAVIAARSRLDIATHTLTNREHALIYSVGDMSIGSTLDPTTGDASGQADTLYNASATISAGGNLWLAIKNLFNTNEHFATETIETGRERLEEYQAWNSLHRYTPDQVSIIDDGVFIVGPEGLIGGPATFFHKYVYYRTTTETRVIDTDPAKILAGKQLQITADNLLNDNSQITAGRDLIGNIETLTNQETLGVRTMADQGYIVVCTEECHPDIDHGHPNSVTPGSTTSYNPAPAVQHFQLGSSSYAGNTQTTSNPYTISPLQNALFKLNPTTSNAKYLIETDPQFVNYRSWIGSDYMLAHLGLDPNLTLKRLGDGFYEQRLLQEQINQLTGRPFLNSYDGTDPEAQYQYLMDNGLQAAENLNLVPGVTLTTEQIAALQQDIVWMVEQTVTLPDGSTTQALVPQVFLRPSDLLDSATHINPEGSLITAKNLALNTTTLNNQGGTITSQGNTQITATHDLNNTGGLIQGKTVLLAAEHDINNIGGLIAADQDLTLLANHDINLQSTTHSSHSQSQYLPIETANRTNLDQTAGLMTTGSNSKLTVAAGNDINLTAAAILNAGQTGATTLAAGNDLNLNTLKESSDHRYVWSAENQTYEGKTQDLGTQMQSTGDIQLIANHDINAKAANITSDAGKLTLSANNDINLTAGQATQTYEKRYKYSDSELFSKTTTTGHDFIEDKRAVQSSLSADSILLASNHDIHIAGSDIIATQDLNLAANHDIHVTPTAEQHNELHELKISSFGVLDGGGIEGALNPTKFIGSREQTETSKAQGTTQRGSTLGSLAGNVNIAANNNYQQLGSYILSPQGDINITAKNIDIQHAQDTYHSEQKSTFEQTGISITSSSPISDAIRNAQHLQSATQKTDNTRLKLLAGAATALNAKNTYDAIQKNPQAAGSAKLSVMFGYSESESSTVQHATTASPSNLTAGHNINLTATDSNSQNSQNSVDPNNTHKNGNIHIQGSQLTATNNITLKADNDILLEAAQNTNTTKSENSSSSGGVGVGFNFGSRGVSISIEAAAALGEGHANGDGTRWTNTHLQAGNQLNLQSGRDTTLIGAIAQGDQLIADVGRNLHIQTLQDSNNYDSKQTEISASVSIPVYGAGSFSASLNYSDTSMKSTLLSATEQSGLLAGDKGFQVHVQDNTNLIGSKISSTEKAAQENKNTLTTGTLTTSDLQNHAEYDAKSVNVGVSISNDNKPGSSTHFTGAPPVAMNAKDNANSTTKAGISNATITITDEDKQKQLTGKDAQTTINTINKDVSTDKDSTNKIAPIFNPEEIQAGFDIVKEFNHESATFLRNRAEASTNAKKALEEELAKSTNQQDPSKIAQYQQTLQDNQTWEMGGAGRTILTAVTLAAGNNVTGSTTQLIQGAAINYLQSLATQEVKQLADQLGNETARAALQGLVACAGASAQSQSCSTAATGAAASVVLNNLVSYLNNNNTKDLTPLERQERVNLVNSIIAGITVAAGGDTVVANAASRIEMENNSAANLAKLGWRVVSPYVSKALRSGARLVKLDKIFSFLKEEGAVETPNDGAKTPEKPPSSPVGRNGNPIKVDPGVNQGETIDGVNYTGHALDQMQGRGIPSSVVKNTIQNGSKFETRTGTMGYYDSVNNIRVIVNSDTQRVVTVIPGKP